ncbi:MAG: DUF6614 family protein [Pseudomonadota bacterium]
MYQMLTMFSLKPGVSMEAFKDALAVFAEHMRTHDLITGIGPILRRHPSSGLDTDSGRAHSHYFLTDFRDLAQSEASFAYLEDREPAAWRIHGAVFSKVKDPLFLFWEKPDGD